MILFEVLSQISDKEHDDDRNTQYRAARMAEQLSQASLDLLRQMVQIFAEALMSADADAVCGAAYGQRSADRRNIGRRCSSWRCRSCGRAATFPTGCWSGGGGESALVSVVATSYPLGVSTRRMEKLVETLGITGLSKSQVSEMAKDPAKTRIVHMSEALDFLGFRIQWRRKRGTSKWTSTPSSQTGRSNR